MRFLALLGALLAVTASAVTLPRLTTEEALRLYPKREASTAALALERLAAPLGVDLVPYHRRKEEGRPEVRRFEHWRELHDHLGRALQDPTPRTPALPMAVARFLEERAGELRAAREHVLRGGPLVWEVDVEPILHPRQPPLLRNLHSLFLVAALDEAAAGKAHEALRFLDGAQRLTDSLAGSPTTYSSLAQLRREAAALRKLAALVPDSFVEAVASRDLRAELRADAAFEAARLERLGRARDLVLDDLIGEILGHERWDWEDRTIRWLQATPPFRGYVRVCLDAAAERARRDADELDALGPCKVGRSDVTERALASFGWWNRLGYFFYPDCLESLWKDLGRFRLELDLTRKVVALERARAHTGRLDPPPDEPYHSYCKLEDLPLEYRAP